MSFVFSSQVSCSSQFTPLFRHRCSQVQHTVSHPPCVQTPPKLNTVSDLQHTEPNEGKTQVLTSSHLMKRSPVERYSFTFRGCRTGVSIDILSHRCAPQLPEATAAAEFAPPWPPLLYLCLSHGRALCHCHPWHQTASYITVKFRRGRQARTNESAL